MPPWGGEPVTLDRYDTLHSALAKLESAGDSFPVVVLASDCRLADNVLLYRLLARTSKRFGLPITVVAPNSLARQLAREHGLRVYRSLGSLRRARGRSPISLPENLADSFLSALVPSISGAGLAFLAAFLLAVGGIVYFFVPVMEVTIRTPSESLSRDLAVRVNVGATEIDPSGGVIPGRIVEHRFTIADFVETAGKSKVGKERAKGEVSMINNSPVVVTVPAGTILSTASGERFNTMAAVTVAPFMQPEGASPGPTAAPSPADATPGATPAPTPAPTAEGGTASPAPAPAAGGAPAGPADARAARASGAIANVPVIAVEPGEKGNVAALAVSKIEGDAFRGLTVFNERELSGGVDAEAKAVSAEDRARLKEMLFQQAQSRALSELTVRVRQSETLVPNSMQVKIEGEEYDKAVNEEGDRLRGTGYVVATGIAFANQDLKGVVEQEWKKSTPEGYGALGDALDLASPEVVEVGARTASLKVRANGKLARVLDVDQVATALRGLSVVDARAKFARLENSLKLVDVEMWPDWAPRAFRIEVRTVQ